MFHSLRLRLLLMLSIVMVFAVGALGYYASRATTSEFQRYLERDFFDYERFVNPFIIFKLQNYLEFRRVDCDQSLEKWQECQRESGTYSTQNQEELQKLVEQMASLAGTRIIVTDKTGRVLANSSVNTDAAPVDLSHEAVSGVMVVGGQPFLVYITLTNTTALGARQQSLLGSINRSLVIAGVSALVAALLFSLLLSRRIFRPIEELTQATRRLGRGDLSHRIENPSTDEIGELSQAFNTMAGNLSRLEQLRRNMVSDVAHELRTPLSTLRGYLEGIQDGLLQPKPEVINSLHEEVMLLSRLVNDLQELALAEAGQIHLKQQPVSLQHITEKAVTALQPKIAEKALRLHTQIPADLPPVEADPERLGQVLRNLLINAITYTPSGGEITVWARAEGPNLEVGVQDTGTGIAPEHLTFLFERFYRVDESRTRATGGAGLGLAIVKQLVQAHGGQVNVTSQQGKGTTFTFTLPVSLPVAP